MLGVSSIVLHAAGCQLHGVAETYDEWVASFGPSVVSYWKFENDGTDEKGTENATVVGSPEFDVETIVDLDTIAEGAPSDGQCIAWPGSPGNYAEVAHNPAHKTPEGTIVVTFQRDSLIAKSTLVAADRTLSGATNGPGGLSIEVEANGAPRCFLRRQSDGAPVVLVGEPGDVVRNEAYTLIVKWGPVGLSMALWNDVGTLVRRRTNPLTDGVTGTSPIRFGLWHDGTSSPHDGPFGRVVWLKQQISETREADLARARSIDRAPAGYLPFPFVGVSNPPVDHTGVASRPQYSPNDPRSASIVDPMSGLELFRVGGNNGSAVLLNGSTDSGIRFPRRQRNENSPRMGSVWNADGTLLMIGRRFSVSGDRGDCSAYIIDVDGSHGASRPFQIIRASNSNGFGEAGVWWFWDPLNPLRAYIIRSSGQVDEWWPIGGAGHAEGEINTLYGPRSGYSNHNSGRRHMINCSWYGTAKGRYYFTGCRESGGARRWGGYRIDLLTGALGPFIPDGFGEFVNNSNHTTQGTSAAGEYTAFQRNGNHHRFFDWEGNFLSDMGPNTMSHIDMTVINGVEYAVGGHSDNTGFRLWDIAGGNFSTKASIPMANPHHTGCLNSEDLFERHGAAGGGSTGQRYAIFTKSNDRGGHSRGIMGIRLGPNDNGEIRYLANHRSNRTTNGNEVHPQVSPDGRMVVFPSNWAQPGVESDGDVHPYVLLVPDGWLSPNNSGL